MVASPEPGTAKFEVRAQRAARLFRPLLIFRPKIGIFRNLLMIKKKTIF